MVDYVCRHIHKYSSLNPKYNVLEQDWPQYDYPHGLCYSTATSIPQEKFGPFSKMLWFQLFTSLKMYEAKIVKIFKFTGQRVCKKQNEKKKPLRITHVLPKITGLQFSYLHCSREKRVSEVVPKTARCGRWFLSTRVGILILATLL